MGHKQLKTTAKYIHVMREHKWQILHPIANIKLQYHSRISYPAMGSLVTVCKGCGEMKWLYKSCGDAKCPVCQSIKRLQSGDKMSAKMLAVPYVHVTIQSQKF